MHFPGILSFKITLSNRLNASLISFCKCKKRSLKKSLRYIRYIENTGMCSLALDEANYYAVDVWFTYQKHLNLNDEKPYCNDSVEEFVLVQEKGHCIQWQVYNIVYWVWNAMKTFSCSQINVIRLSEFTCIEASTCKW